jgi:hypothetical protein
MIIKKPLVFTVFALTVFAFMLFLGYSAINRDRNAFPIPTTDEPKTTAEGLALLPPSTPTLTPASLLSIHTSTTMMTEALATAMIAMHPYSDTLLYSPVLGYSPEFQFTETTIGSNLDWKVDEVTNPSDTFRAFTACNSDLCHGRLFVENLSTGQVFEIQFSGYMAWRPITQMTWLDDDVLLFTHPTQPNYGYRYAVNVNEQRLLLAILVTDECFVYGKCD